MGGVADYTALLAESLRRRGHTVTVVARRAPTLGASRSHASDQSVRWVSNWGPLTILRLARWMMNSRVDVVHLQYQAAAFMDSRWLHVLPSLLRSLGVRSRFVTTFHDLRVPYLFPKAGPLRKWAVHRLVTSSDGVVCTDVSDLIQCGRRDHAVWIPIGPNIVPTVVPEREQARLRWGLPGDALVLAYFGFLNASKGAEDLLGAASLLRVQGLPVRILFIGDETGSSDRVNQVTARAIRAKADDLNLGPQIQWTGWLSPPGVSEALSAADMAVLPYKDGASLRRGSLLACFAHGLPVVTTEPAPAPEAPGWALVAPFNEREALRLDRSVAEFVPADAGPEGLARGITAISNDAVRGNELSNGGRALAARLSWEAIAQASEEFYGRVLADEHVDR